MHPAPLWRICGRAPVLPLSLCSWVDASPPAMTMGGHCLPPPRSSVPIGWCFPQLLPCPYVAVPTPLWVGVSPAVPPLSTCVCLPPLPTVSVGVCLPLCLWAWVFSVPPLVCRHVSSPDLPVFVGLSPVSVGVSSPLPPMSVGMFLLMCLWVGIPPAAPSSPSLWVCLI